MMRNLSNAAIVLAWVTVAILVLFGGEIGIGSATLMLLMWMPAVAGSRLLSRVLASASVLVLLITLAAYVRTDTEALIAFGLVVAAAALTWRPMNTLPADRDGTSYSPGSSLLLGTDSVAEQMETHLIEQGVVDDESLDSGICGAELVARDGAELILRAKSSGAFTEAELLAIRHALSSSQAPVRSLRRLIGEGELSKFQAMHLLWGQELQLRFGDYILIDTIGRGASSIVYRARHVRSGDPIALKIMHADEQSIRRVHREMKSVLKLAHPNIVVAYDSGKIHSRYFIAMELMGSDLSRFVRERGPMDQYSALVSVLQIALALEQAHERGVLHRDVKPGNMLLAASGDVKLADLGLSCSMQRVNESGTFETAHNALGGTLEFMAPEQVRDFRDVDARADTFGLGSSLFFLLTGMSRLPGKNLAERINNLTVHKRFLCSSHFISSPQVAELVDQLCAYEVEDRIQSAADAVNAIRRAITELGKPDHRSLIRLMVVEGNQGDIYRTVERLTESNHALETHRATSLDEAVAVCREAAQGSPTAHFDLVFLDADGLGHHEAEILHRIREVACDAALIMVSDQDDDDHQLQCLNCGADSFLSKHDLTVDKMEREIFVTHARRRVADQHSPSIQATASTSIRVPSVAI